ncbi:MAG: glycine cleavage system protein GcvH [Bacteroidetes bacterium]|nr:glycine cleavage system protein GcvH [Bacteroidales bacterium]RLD59744.1 MAG: glycine cleavage system protein GcvH [Bacteroidota bacterium]RLD72652.1 MAG: glycine cleavage system protein GcvH [Bacteroidota bacterium]RLD92137.1 MAG: glycine cleavage system protein GcvH [Bacteroidota bacterium]
MSVPAELKYTAEHEWIRVEGDEIVIGVTEFAQGELGDVVFIEIETEGESLSRGETFGTIEAVKTVSDLYMPVDGEIVKVNPALEDTPELVNSEPFEGGWMIRIKLTDPSQLDDLMPADEYSALIG